MATTPVWCQVMTRYLGIAVAVGAWARQRREERESNLRRAAMKLGISVAELRDSLS